jgi:hypothetical protein
MVRLLRLTDNGIHYEALMFQSHNGAIAALTLPAFPAPPFRFNPTMVRLLHL